MLDWTSRSKIEEKKTPETSIRTLNVRMYNICGSIWKFSWQKQSAEIPSNKSKVPVEFGEMDAMRIIVHLSLIMRQRKRAMRRSFNLRESAGVPSKKRTKRTFTDADRSDEPIWRNVFSFGSIPPGRSRALHSLRRVSPSGLIGSFLPRRRRLLSGRAEVLRFTFN